MCMYVDMYMQTYVRILCIYAEVCINVNLVIFIK